MFDRACLLCLLSFAACGPVEVSPIDIDDCTEQRITEQHFGVVDLGESPAQSTAVRLVHDAGVTLVLTAARGDGRLFLQVHEPLQGGPIPRDTTTSTGCTLPDRLLWRAVDTGKRYPAAGTFSVLDGGSAPGESLSFRVSNLSFQRDGGTALPDFEASIVVPGP